MYQGLIPGVNAPCMQLTNINSDWMSNASSGPFGYIILRGCNNGSDLETETDVAGTVQLNTGGNELDLSCKRTSVLLPEI